MERLDYCNNCPQAINDVCMECKILHPDRDCLISVGVQMIDAHCPLGLWQQEWTIVITNPDRQVVRAAYDMSVPLLIGTIPPWYLGKSILSPPRYHSPYTDHLRWLQKTIDSPDVTETFLWVENGLTPLPFNKYRVPHYTNSPINPINEVLLLERGLPTLNYETPWPSVFNKGMLQEILDTYRSPYHMATIYHNHYPQQQPIIDSLPEKMLPRCAVEAF